MTLGILTSSGNTLPAGALYICDIQSCYVARATELWIVKPSLQNLLQINCSCMQKYPIVLFGISHQWEY